MKIKKQNKKHLIIANASIIPFEHDKKCVTLFAGKVRGSKNVSLIQIFPLPYR